MKTGWCLGADSNHRHADFQAARFLKDFKGITLENGKWPTLSSLDNPATWKMLSSPYRV